MNARPLAKKVWSPFQKAIFDDFRNGRGNVYIDAVPGSGKTTSLIEALNHLPPSASDVMMTSFSVESVNAIKAQNPPWFVDVRTMNSLGNRAITERFGLQKINKERVFSVLDQVLGERPQDPAMRSQFNGYRSRIKALVDLAKAYLVETPDELEELGIMFEMDATTPDWIGVELEKRFRLDTRLAEKKFKWAREDVIFVAAHLALQRCKEVTGFIDFNDQVWLPFVYQLKLEQFGLVIVDEAQDTSLAQMDLLVRSCRPKGRIILAGEDAQAIYAWRGAGLGMQPFVKQINARRMPLSISYRCPKAVVREAARVVQGIQAAPEAPEGSVSECSQDMLPSRLLVGDAVLSRTNAPLIKLFMDLLSHGRPVTMRRRNIGEKLSKFILKSEAADVDGLLDYTNRWANTETDRRQQKNPNAKIDHIADHVRCIEVLCEDRTQLSEVRANISKLLMADPDGGSILLSTVHAGKGLEWDRVFLLEETFPTNACYWLKYAKKGDANKWAQQRAESVMKHEPEERHIRYVAISRAKRELVFVLPVGASSESA